MAQRTVYDWRERDNAFREEMDELDARVTENLRAHIFEQALSGSDLLAIFEAKRRDPEYRDRQPGVTVNLHDNREQNGVIISLGDLRQGLAYLEQPGRS